MNVSMVSARNCIIRITLPVLAWTVTMPAVHCAQSEKDQVLAKAGQSYYNLRRSGLIEFHSNIKPNWDLLLTGVDTKTGGTNLLDGLQFSVSIDAESNLRMEHDAGIAPPNQKSREEFDKIFKGMDDALSSFFVTWSIFMLTSPFPKVGSEYELKDIAGQYRFSHKERVGDVLTITDKNFMIIEMIVFGENFTASLKPVLEKTARGYILKAYTGSYQTPSGARETVLKVWLDYQEIRGLQLPRKVNLDTVYEGKPAQMEWLFTDYQVKVR